MTGWLILWAGPAPILNSAPGFLPPIMLVGLQGCGKTTTAAKLARLLSSEQKKVYLVSADVYRPAAMEQLSRFGKTDKRGCF